MKSRWYKYLLMIMFSGVLVELFAAGTPAGTVLQSRSRVTFTSKNGTQIDTVYSAYVSVTVTQKAAFNLTPAANAFTTQSDSTNVEYPVAVINSGNGNDRSKLSALSSKGWTTQIFADGNSDGILQVGEINAGTIGQTSLLAADEQYAIIVRVKVPRGESLNGVKDTTTLIVKSNFDSTTSNSGKYVTNVRTSGLDPLNPGLTVNNSTPAAGQQVTYSFSVTNGGSVPANNISISDVIPVGCVFISGTQTIGELISSANTEVWNIGTLSPSQTAAVTLTVQVSSGVAPGTVISNQFGMNYSVAANSYSVSTNSVSITVSGKIEYGVRITPMFTTLTKEASDTAWYRYNIRNTGSFKDLIELSFASSKNLEWKLYKDANNDGSWDISDFQLVNTNDSAGVDIDTVAVGDSVRVFAVATVPRLEADQLKDSMLLVARSAGDHSKFHEIWTETTMKVPVVAINKSAFPIGNQPAGSFITYTITYSNTGSVAVKNFSVVDATPNETNYVPNSVKVNGVSVSDTSPGVTITKDQNNNSVIAVSIGALAANSNGSVEFKVKIK